MVTHDVFSACYCERILLLCDGKIYAELERGNSDKRDYLNHYEMRKGCGKII